MSIKSERLPGSGWQVTLNFSVNMGYVWFREVVDTYVDYGDVVEPDIAYAVKDAESNEVVGVFIQDLRAALALAKKLEQEQRESLSLGLLADRQWSLWNPRPIGT